MSVVSSASRPQGRWNPPLEGVEQTAMRCKSALPRERSKCTHSQARGIVVNGAMTRPAPTRQEEAHHATVEAVRDAAHGVPVEGHRHSPPIRSRTGARSQTAQALTVIHALGACSRPDSPARAASTRSPCSVATLRGREGLRDGSKNRHRLQTEGVGEVTSQTACALSSCRSPRRGRIERQTVGELAAGVDVPRVSGGRHEAGGSA